MLVGVLGVEVKGEGGEGERAYASEGLAVGNCDVD